MMAAKKTFILEALKSQIQCLTPPPLPQEFSLFGEIKCRKCVFHSMGDRGMCLKMGCCPSLQPDTLIRLWSSEQSGFKIGLMSESVASRASVTKVGPVSLKS